MRFHAILLLKMQNDNKLQTYGQFLISAVRIRTLGEFENIEPSERIWTLSHGIVLGDTPCASLSAPHSAPHETFYGDSEGNKQNVGILFFS